VENVGKRVPITDHPKMLVMPVFLQPPGILIGQTPNTRLNLVYRVFERRNRTLTPTEQGTKVFLHFENAAFVRMLAKIAHGFAVGELGLDGFDPDLPDLVLGRNLALASYLIGLSNEQQPVTSGLLSHQIGWGIFPWANRLLIGVRMCLFAVHGTPAYTVIVGVASQRTIQRHQLAELNPS
jgi:hypothetical protein